MVDAGHSMVLCAPTGKAARNLEKRTGLSARTVHSALGMHPDEDFPAPVTWNTTQLVVVDEASMMTLEMLAGILHRVPKICRVVLLGIPTNCCLLDQATSCLICWRWVFLAPGWN